MISIVLLSVVGLASMIIGLFNVSSRWVWGMSLTSILVSAYILSFEWGLFQTYFNDMLFFDNYAIAFSIAILILSCLVFMVSESAIDRVSHYRPEQYALFTFAIVGMLCMVSFDHMAMLFVGVEIMSISLYILAGSSKKELASNESAIKYLLMGSFTTGVILMGIALVYGETSTFHLYKISKAIDEYNDLVNSPLLAIGVMFLLIGMAFKVALVPFHFWTPDVYQGAPTHVTTFMSTIVKTAGIATFFRLFMYCFVPLGEIWVNVLVGITVLTILVGGISAVIQTSVKRMLAYSGISHTGYIMIVFLTADATKAGSILFYTVAYSIASIAAISITMLLERNSGSDSIDAFNGLHKTNPMLSFFLAISMLSLAGIPLTAGFFAKFYVFSTGIEYGYIWLVVLAVINAIIAIFYYLKLIIAVYFKEPAPTHTKIAVSPMFMYTMALCALFTLQFGLFPDTIYLLFSK